METAQHAQLCARKTCNTVIYDLERYNGHCSYRCNNLTANGEKRSIAMNGGITKNDPRATILRTAGFTLEKTSAYGNDRHWKLPFNSATISFNGSYYGPRDINLNNYNHFNITVRGSYLDKEEVRTSNLAHFSKVTDAIKFAASLPVPATLRNRVLDVLEPKDREIEALDILEQYLTRKLDDQRARLEGFQKEYNECPVDSNKKLELHAECMAHAGSISYLKSELRQVKIRRDGDSSYNRSHPLESPAYLYLTPTQNNLSGNNYGDEARELVLTGVRK